MKGTLQYITRRVLTSLLALVGVSLIVFIIVRVLPGDPARIIAGLLATEEEVERIRVAMGLDRPLPVQYWDFVTGLLQGDLGTSLRTRRPVLVELVPRLKMTMLLATTGTILGSLLGITAGVVGAARRYTRLDYLLSSGSLVGISMPVYWLGYMLIIVFAVNLRWFPAAGADEPSSIVLPTLTLAAFSMALVARMTRGSMLEVLGQDYIRTARAKGLAERVVIYRHALRNALIPVLTVIGLQFGSLLGGAVLTESVFAWPGMGVLLVNSIINRDYPMVQGIVLVYAVLVVLLNLVVDLAYGWADPRIRYD
ncbi:MAG: ABC transporter permease [Thermaerobacter sp.]|nr:peptide ABC transporter permease [Bacillota bacterium]REJ37151.1 MAG: peptide ABC transporter permease [Bacillota bacterium]